MNALKAHDDRGRLVVDEPTELLEGAEIAPVAIGGEDESDDSSRARLHAELDEALVESDEYGVDAAELIAELRASG